MGLIDRLRLCEQNVSESQQADIFVERIREMNRSFGIPEVLPELMPADIPHLVKSARQEVRFTYAVPRYFSKKECGNLIARMLS